MKNNAVPFATLQRVLEGLGFVKKEVPRSHIYFQHDPSDSLLLFRLYRPREKVSEVDLIRVRKFLDEKGIIEPDDLEELLHQPSA
ncbi:MAG: hypothetical protein L0Z62_39940 [Gemmataceae bacterium]|nr:hypothetical protein [Gemmataceae bacterium]